MSLTIQYLKSWSAAALLTLLAFVQVYGAQNPVSQPDSALHTELQKQLQTGQLNGKMYYPASVSRFYKANGFQPVWIKQQGGMGHAWQAMLMIDCVLQFGLSHNDYHPQDLTYGNLHNVLDTPGKASPQVAARFELLLTDAILTLMNHLHFGKLNPGYGAAQIDRGVTAGFSAGEILAAGLLEKYILPAITGVQPKFKAYTNLQARMHLLEGVYKDDCYVVPQAEVRKIAINMERLRWVGATDSVYVDINIPSYNLKLYLRDTVREFKVIVGKPETPTPTLSSEIRYMTTAPEWKVPAKIFRREVLVKALKDTTYLENNHFAVYDLKGRFVEPTLSNLRMVQKTPASYFAKQSAGCDNALGLVVFRFANSFDVYLHDTPEPKLFKRKDRAFSHGCIRLENAAEFGKLLLQNDGAPAKVALLRQGMQQYITRNINLKTPVPIRINYLTCAIGEWGLITYPDIYGLDGPLEMALYGTAITAKTQ